MEKLIGFFIAEKLKGDKETLRKASFTVASCLIVIAFSVIGVLYAALFINSLSYLSVGVAFLSLVILSLFIFRENGSFLFMANFLGAVSFLATAAAPLETGGIYSPDLFSLLAVPVFVLVIGTRRLAFFWSIMTILTFFAFYIAEEMGLANFKQQVANNSSVYCLQGLLTMSIIILFLVMRNEKLRLDLLDEVKEAHRQVSEKQKEILDSIHYAKRIQTALLPNEKMLEKNLGGSNKKT